MLLLYKIKANSESKKLNEELLNNPTIKQMMKKNKDIIKLLLGEHSDSKYQNLNKHQKKIYKIIKQKEYD